MEPSSYLSPKSSNAQLSVSNVATLFKHCNVITKPIETESAERCESA
ncbi:hypothetical protein [Vibrio gallaecicus]|nr:hypothetical protein [Vibrio gallaecicus]MDN3617316.1 hypothetical protein [Vibrio gallaecicus]